MMGIANPLCRECGSMMTVENGSGRCLNCGAMRELNADEKAKMERFERIAKQQRDSGQFGSPPKNLHADGLRIAADFARWQAALWAVLREHGWIPSRMVTAEGWCRCEIDEPVDHVSFESFIAHIQTEIDARLAAAKEGA